MYWPGIDNDIDNVIFNCKQCQDGNPPEPIIIKPRPDRPFQEIAADFCFYAAQDFLILVDGKIEATVKSMKKLIQASWAHHCLDEGKPYFNTTHPPEEMADHQHKNFSDNPSRTYFRLTIEHLHQSGKEVRRKPTIKQLHTEKRLNFIITTVPNLSLRYTLAQVSLSSTNPQNVGTFMALS